MPLAIDELPAVIAIDCSVAAVTERAKVVEEIPLCVAVMLLDPVPTPDAKPPTTLTAAAFEELHVAELVRFCVLPSLKVPVAVNCSEVPFAIEAFGPLTVIDCSVAAVTANAKIFDVIPPCAAVMLLEPTATPVNRPVPAIVAAAGFEEVQVTELVTFPVKPSLYVPIAVS